MVLRNSTSKPEVQGRQPSLPKAISATLRMPSMFVSASPCTATSTVGSRRQGTGSGGRTLRFSST